MNVDPAPRNAPEYVICIRVAEAHAIIDGSRHARCSRCGEPVWLSERTEDAAGDARLICSTCFGSLMDRRLFGQAET